MSSRSVSSLDAVVASGSEIVRGGIAELLRGRFDCTQVGETTSWSGLQATLATAERVGLIVVDLSLLVGDDQRALRRLRLVHQHTKVIVIGQCRQRLQILAMISAGAHGYIPESMPLDEIAAAVETVMAGHVYLPDTIGDLGMVEHERADADAALTRRQQQVLHLLTRGASNKEIADELRLAEGTVKVHLGGLFRVLGVRSRTAAVASVHAQAY